MPKRASREIPEWTPWKISQETCGEIPEGTPEDTPERISARISGSIHAVITGEISEIDNESTFEIKTHEWIAAKSFGAFYGIISWGNVKEFLKQLLEQLLKDLLR